MNNKNKYIHNDFWVGVASFFGGISQDMMVPILPLYLSQVLNFDKTTIGLIDGALTGSTTICKIIAGFLSDKFHNRKHFVIGGYFLSWIGRPLLALAASGWSVFLLRILDGMGKGTKDAPKEALIADSTNVATRGRGFGIVRMLDTFGSVVGPVILWALLYFLKNNGRRYQYIFLLTTIPLSITLLILAIFVHDVPLSKQHHQQNEIFSSHHLPTKFYLFLLIALLFAIGNFSDSFIILRAQQGGISLLQIPFLYALLNMVYALGAVPLGILSDVIGRPKVILIGWGIYAFTYLGFASAHETYQIWLLCALYGLYYATTYGAIRAFIADLVPMEQRGKAYGIYNAVTGIAALPAGFIAGLLWDAYGMDSPFLFGAITTSSAIVLFWMLSRK